MRADEVNASYMCPDDACVQTRSNDEQHGADCEQDKRISAEREAARVVSDVSQFGSQTAASIRSWLGSSVRLLWRKAIVRRWVVLSSWIRLLTLLPCTESAALACQTVGQG